MKSVQEIKRTLKELKEKYKVKEIGIFGSYVRDEQKGKSDLDIMVEFEEYANLSLLYVVSLEIELSDLLGIKVDLVERKSLKPYIGQYILSEVIYV